MAEQSSDKLDAILSGIDGSKHILHLYAPSTNKYAIQAAFLSKKRRGKTAYVTGEKPAQVLEQFESIADKLSVLHPFHLDKLKDFSAAIIDVATISSKLFEKKSDMGLRLKKQTIHKRKSIGQDEILASYVNHIERENYLNELKTKSQILCTYDISTLDPDKIKQLVQTHDKLILTTDDTMVLSSTSLSSKNLKLDEKMVEKLVKNELETIILTLVSSKPMCGNDIKKGIYEKFNILLSSGTIYPLLHQLEKQGLLKCEYGIKTKVYKTKDDGEVKKILNNTLQVKNFLNGLVQSTIVK